MLPILFYLMETVNKNSNEVNVPMVPSEEKPMDSVMNYRLTKKSAWGMGLVCLASIFGR